MHYTVVIADEAQKQLRKLHEGAQKQILADVNAWAENPVMTSKRIKPLHHELKGLYRLRSGDYRVIFKIEHNELVMLILEVGDRKDVYQ